MAQSGDRSSESSGYSEGLGYGFLGAGLFLLSPIFLGLVFYRGPFVALVAYLCLAAVTGLLFGLAGVYRRPLNPAQSTLAAGVTLTFPVLITLLLTFENPAFIVFLLPNAFALCIISLETTYIPKLHRRYSVERDGVWSVEIGHVVVPAVTTALMITVVTSGAVVVGDAHGSRCGHTQSGFGHSTTPAVPQASWEFTTTNGLTEITHAGGDNIPAERVFVEVNQSSIAWSRLGSNDDDTVTAGDRVTAPYSESGATLELIYRDASDDCEYKLAEHEIP